METNKTHTEQLTQDAVMQSVLKASDLRVGNLLNLLGEIVKVECISNVFKRKDMYWISTEGLLPMKIFHFKPILLTEEWLNKLGYDLISENHFGVLGHLIWKIEGRFYCDKNGVQLKYVHQLQNLYFALTQRELTVA